MALMLLSLLSVDNFSARFWAFDENVNTMSRRVQITFMIEALGY